MKAVTMKTMLVAAMLWSAAILTPTLAADPGQIRLEDGFTRSAPTGGAGVFYVTIVNSGSADRLIGVTSAVAGKAELHESVSENGIMKMRSVPALTVPANGTVRLAPGGYHVMLIGLTQPLVVGQSVNVTMTFEKAGALTVAASVGKAGAIAPMSHDMGSMSHDMQHK